MVLAIMKVMDEHRSDYVPTVNDERNQILQRADPDHTYVAGSMWRNTKEVSWKQLSAEEKVEFIEAMRKELRTWKKFDAVRRVNRLRSTPRWATS